MPDIPLDFWPLPWSDHLLQNQKYDHRVSPWELLGEALFQLECVEDWKFLLGLGSWIGRKVLKKWNKFPLRKCVSTEGVIHKWISFELLSNIELLSHVRAWVRVVSENSDPKERFLILVLYEMTDNQLVYSSHYAMFLEIIKWYMPIIFQWNWKK